MQTLNSPTVAFKMIKDMSWHETDIHIGFVFIFSGLHFQAVAHNQAEVWEQRYVSECDTSRKNLVLSKV